MGYYRLQKITPKTYCIKINDRIYFDVRIFEIRDKTGRLIYLTKERWSHIQKHPAMSSALEKIKETLQNPLCITEFEFDPNVRFYHRHYKERKEYLLVSVKYLNGDGFIISSFYTDKIK